MKSILFLNTLVLSFISFAADLALAQTAAGRHPRVLEIERLLQNDVQSVLRDLLPGQSFNVKVRVEPLRRTPAAATAKESLPYYETADELRDEWDDPNKTDFELLNRVNRISAKVILTHSLSVNQIAEIKAAVQSRLPMIEGRDLVEIEQKEWPVAEDHNRYTTWVLGIGLALMLVLGVVYFVVSSVAIGRITKAIANIKISQPEGGGSTAALPQVSGTSLESSIGDSPSFGSGQVQFNDTLRMTEVIFGLIKNIQNSPAFPTLEDMIIFENYIQSQPKSIGALLAEFPQNLKNQVFSMSYSEIWLKALTDTGDIDFVSLELMNKLMKVDRSNDNKNWENLLISCWRLDKSLATFLKQIEPMDALYILQHLPQSISISAAREVMPGEWAAVLKEPQEKMKLSDEKAEKYIKISQQMRPLRSFAVLEQYRRDADLIKYLRQTDFQMEKEIYGAIPQDSSLRTLRPPFFRVFEAESQVLSDFANFISIEEWALALLNVPRTDRGMIEVGFSERKKFRFIELLKKYDKSGVSPELIGRAREQIARQFEEYMRNLATTTPIIELKPKLSEAA